MLGSLKHFAQYESYRRESDQVREISIIFHYSYALMLNIKKFSLLLQANYLREVLTIKGFSEALSRYGITFSLQYSSSNRNLLVICLPSSKSKTTFWSNSYLMASKSLLDLMDSMLDSKWILYTIEAGDNFKDFCIQYEALASAMPRGACIIGSWWGWHIISR